MFQANKKWWDDVDLPKSTAQWKAAAESTYFKDPLQDDEHHERLRRQRNVNLDKLHAGERVSDVHPRNLSGWESASKIQRSHFLTTRILWDFKRLNTLKYKDAQALFEGTKEADDVSKEHLKNSKDWKKYREDVQTNAESRPPMGQANNLGTFSFVRDQQLAVNKTLNEYAPHETVSMRTRSRSEKQHQLFSGQGMDTGDHMGRETSSSESEASSEYKPSSTQETVDTMDTGSDQGHVTSSTGSHHGSGSGSQGSMSRSQGDLTGSEPSLSRAFTQGSAHSVADDELYPAFKGEETVNFAAIALLRTLTMGCPEAKLEWEANRKGFVHQLGEACIRAYTDGCLSSENKEDVHAILEVKPFTLTKRSEQTLMQMSIEMLAYILYCELNGKPKKRYFMEACFRHQFFHVLADFDRVNYLNFLQGLESEFDHSFLTLKLVGPFDLFIRNDVYKLGRMSLTLTIQMSMDEQAQTETAAIEEAERQEQGEEEARPSQGASSSDVVIG